LRCSEIPLCNKQDWGELLPNLVDARLADL
jgi:hypothetical protein